MSDKLSKMLKHSRLIFFLLFAILKKENCFESGGDPMDIAAMSLSLSACSTNTNISIAMMSKVLDTVEVAGEALTEMIESVPTPGLGERIDILA